MTDSCPLGVALLLGVITGCARPTSPVINLSSPYRSEIARGPIAVIGDTQSTSMPERLIGREDNSEGRRALFEGLSRETPGAVVHLGDMVSDASSSGEWREFDALLRPLGVPVLPTLGNHDYGGPNAALTARFPWLSASTWYAREFGPIRLVWLDSNREELGPRWDEEGRWFTQLMDTYDASPEVHGVLVFCHHPPYTRSTVVGDAVEVQEAFLSALLRAKKGLALFSGHAHGYEHYVRAGRHFVVTAGGGGPRPRGLARKGWPEVTDAYPGESQRPLNYVLLEVRPAEIFVRVRGLERSGIVDIDQFAMPLALSP